MTASRGSAATEALLAAPPKTPTAPGHTPPSVWEHGRENRAGGKPRPDGAPHVIGIDPSLTGTGIASSHGWCEHRGYKDITTLPRANRLAMMLRLVTEVVELAGNADLVVMEGPAFSKTAGGAHERAYLWWRLFERLTGLDIPIAVMSTNQRMMYATGKGSALKGAVIDAVARRWPDFNTGGNDNRADAVILMAAGLDAAGHPLTPMPATHRRALDAITWPPGWRAS